MKTKELNVILTVLNSSNDLGFKYPIGNRELYLKTKELEQKGLIYYDDKFFRWKKQ